MVAQRELVTTFWNQTGSANSIFKEVLSQLGFNGHCPHSVRNSLVHHGYDLCKSTGQIVAWSQNLGPEDCENYIFYVWVSGRFPTRKADQ